MRITIRICGGALSFSAQSHGAAGRIDCEVYPLRPGVSVAANLRQAFSDGVADRFAATEALVVVDTPVLLLPIEEFEAGETEPLYHHVCHLTQSHKVAHSVLPGLNAVAVFAVDSDVATVVGDRYESCGFMPLMQPVWKYMHKRSFTGSRASLFVYFHDGSADVMSFRQNRFRFYNRFDARHSDDAVFYILYVWKQLGLDFSRDNLNVAGEAKEHDDTMGKLRRYVKNVRQLNVAAASANSQRLSGTEMPIDLQLLYTTGR